MYGLFKDQNANGMIPNHCYSCLLFIFQGIDLCLFHTTALILFPSSCLEWLDPLCLLFLMTSTKEWWVELESLVDVGSKNVSLNSKVLFLQTLSCHPMKKKNKIVQLILIKTKVWTSLDFKSLRVFLSYSKVHRSSILCCNISPESSK